MMESKTVTEITAELTQKDVEDALRRFVENNLELAADFNISDITLHIHDSNAVQEDNLPNTFDVGDIEKVQLVFQLEENE